MTAIPKPRPRALVKADRSKGEDKLYRQSRLAALARDKHCCRICGAGGYLETHHVARRSAFGVKRVAEKHAISNLYSVCRDCHKQLTGNVLKAVATTTQGTNGPVLITKWDDRTCGFVTYRKAA